eukprot:COSAG02_NODE_1667_length_11414_cov_17.655179_2_plen_379_part_00
MQRGALGGCLLVLGLLPHSAGRGRQLGPALPSVADIERELAAAYASEEPPGTAVFTTTGLTKRPVSEDHPDVAPLPTVHVPAYAEVEQLVAPACEAAAGPGCAVLTRGYSRLLAQESAVPPYLECDACGAIAWQLRDGIRRANVPTGAPPGTVNLFPERLWWRHRDKVYVDVCQPSTFAPYALEAIELEDAETGWVLDGEGAEGIGFAGVQLRDPGFLQQAMAKRCAEMVREVGAPELHFLLSGQSSGGSAVDDELRASVCVDALHWCGEGGPTIDDSPAEAAQRRHSHKKHSRKKHRLSTRSRTGGSSLSTDGVAHPIAASTATIISLEATASVTDPRRLDETAGGDECAPGWTGPDCLDCTAGFVGEFCDEMSSGR